MSAKKGPSKRELISAQSDERYVRRDTKGQFRESADAARSLAKDVKRASKKKVSSGQSANGHLKDSDGASTKERATLRSFQAAYDSRHGRR